MNNVYLFQPQYTSEFQNKLSCWLPYSVGCIWSYVSQFDDIRRNFRLADIVFRREPHQDVIDRMKDPAVCAFSCYAWNYQYNVLLAEKIKQHWPKCHIIFGGPQVTSEMLKFNFIESIFLAEGELNFLTYLRQILEHKSVDSIYVKNRLEQLDIPSPYVTDVFKSIIEQNPEITWSMTLETNRGCPYSCTFCDWGSAVYSKVKKFNLEKIALELSWANNNNVGYLECADANFGIFKDRDFEIAKLIRSACDQPTSKIKGIRINFLKNGNETAFKIGKVLGKYLRNGITLSVQSMHKTTLTHINRDNMELNEITAMLELSEKYDVPTYSELILGLPEETLESWKNGLTALLEYGQHQSIDVWYLQLLPNSEIAQPVSRKRYGIKTIATVDYMNQWQSIDSKEHAETMEIVNSTNTMTLDDMIEAYLYSWLIIQFHSAGYTQLIARYCRYIGNVSYREYYDRFLEAICQDSCFKGHYLEVKATTKTYFTEGVLINQDRIKGNGIHAMSFDFVYEHKGLASQLGVQVAQSFLSVPDSVIELQKFFVYDQQVEYPLTLSSNFNIQNWNHELSIYQVSSKVTPNSGLNLFQMRRTGILKNKFVQIN
jgi:hypothetical protein